MEMQTAIEFKFDLFGDYKKQFADYVKYVFKIGKDKSVEERKELITQLTNAYIDTVGERPDGKQLERLGTLLLLDVYKDTSTNKKYQENPILSFNQIKNRTKKETEIPDNL